MQMTMAAPPLERGVENAILLLEVLIKYGETCNRVAQKQQAAQEQQEAQLEAEDQEEQVGNTPTEFTSLLMAELKEITPDESWDDEFRTSLGEQLVGFLDQSTFIDPEYLVKEYQRYLAQVSNAPMQRLRQKLGGDRKAMLKDYHSDSHSGTRDIQ